MENKKGHQKHLVALKWNDAHGSATESYSENDIPHEPLLMTTYGLLLRDDDVGVSVANEECGDGTYRGYTFVPRPLVVELLDLGEPKPKRLRRPRPHVAQGSINQELPVLKGEGQ